MAERGRGALFHARYRDRKTGQMVESPVWSMSYQAYRNGRWQQIRKSTGETDKTRAGKVLNAVMAKEERRESDYTLQDGVDALKAEYAAKGQRWERARLSCDRLVEYFGEHAKLGDIRTKQIRKYRNERLGTKTRRGKAPSAATVNRELAALKTIFNLAAVDEEVESVPAFRSIMLKEKNEDTAQYISPEQLREITEEMPEYAALAVRFLYVSGLRVRDMLSLRWADIEDGWVRVYIEKKDTHRELPVIGPMEEVLSTLQARRSAVARSTGTIPEHVFIMDDGSPVTYWRLRRPWEAHRGDDSLRLHDCRASCVRNLHRAGIPSLQAKEWTAHSSVDVHGRYLTTDRLALGEIGEKYEQLLAGAL